MNNRLSRLRNLMKSKSYDAILVSSVPNITYLTNFSNFSKEEREGFLLITAQPQGLTHKTPEVLGYILTDGRYSEAVGKSIQDFELLEISNKNPLDDIFKSLSRKIKSVGIEEDNISLSESKSLKKWFKVSPLKELGNLRITKDENEISKIKNACEIGDKTFKFILTKIKEGVSEKEIAFEIEMFIKRDGADISFPPIVAFGKNSSIPHHQTSNQRLKANSQVLLDFGVKFENYCSDMTRTIFFGKADEKLKKIYNAVLSAQQKALNFLDKDTPLQLSTRSVLTRDVDRVARNYIINQGFPAIPHSLGHGIGLEVHESPRLSPNSKDILGPGMVFSVEPGIYIPGSGGVRIEDLVVLGKTGSRVITRSPKEIIEL